MCGLTGFLVRRADLSREEMEARVRNMADAIVHRGPDDSGSWVDPAAGIALGFRRLAIIDLSEAGHQPMTSASGRYVIVFNGEVYNFEAIRRELVEKNLAPAFRGHSDTEVMLAAVEAFGLVNAVKRFIGMFAFALWDREARELHLVRDRVGVKPMYYGWSGESLVFGSELKALRRTPGFSNAIDRGALALFVRHNYIPAPYSIYEGIRKVQPGTIVTIASGSREPVTTTYWSASEMAGSAVASRSRLTDGEATDALDALLRDAVGLRMISDVPLGVFLSGGFDSSVVVAMMQVQSAKPVKTFTIGFHEELYNEADHARAVAAHLGTDHTELYVTPQEALEVIPRLPSMYDEPFADSSQIPTHLVSALARKHVTVSLSGDGGDELFGGYNRYFLSRALWRKIERVPRVLRRGVSRTITAVRPRTWERLWRVASPLFPSRVHRANPVHKLLRAADILASPSADAMYHGLVSQWHHPEQIVRGAIEPPTPLTDRSRWRRLDDFTERMMYLDLVTYLPDDILVKVDRASMAISLESREPLLDHRLIEFAWRLPMSMKIREGGGKWLLRQVLYRYVPRQLMERPKMGFGVPIDQWLRGPLRDWAESLLDRGTLERQGFFDPGPIRKVWEEHVSGKRNWQYSLWTILMFQQWLREAEGAA